MTRPKKSDLPRLDTLTSKQRVELANALIGMFRADGEEEFPAEFGYEDVPTDALHGHAISEPVAGNDAANSILQLIAQVRVLEVLLLDAEENEFAAIKNRLGMLKEAVTALPDKAKPRRRLGFAPPEPTTKKRGKKS